MPMDRRPHIGEYVAKTNALPPPPASLTNSRNRACQRPARRRRDVNAALLPVILQNLIAGGGDLGAMVLQTGQNREIALVHHATAKALDVARAGLLLFRCSAALLGHCTGRNSHRQEAECEEKLMHFVPSFLTAESPLSSPWMGRAERSPFIADAADRDDRRSKALVNAA